MNIDLMPYFEKYKEVAALADSVFDRVRNQFPDEVKCVIECSDCCYALFDITLIEALYVNHHFYNKFEGGEKETLINKCNRADRKIYKLKKIAYKDFKSGMNEAEIFMKMGKERVRCPLLNDENRCDLYEHRPITCRLYGIPTSVGGTGHTCGLSGFKEGDKYPSVDIGKIQNKLYKISEDFVLSINTRYSKMADMLVPVSTAILTEYNEDYLGIKKRKKL